MHEIRVMEIPTVKAFKNVMWPLPMLSRYDRMPKKTSKNESTMLVYPMTGPRSKPILSLNGRMATITSEEIAPEISPKVSMVFFMELSLCALRDQRGQPAPVPWGVRRLDYPPPRGASSPDNSASVGSQILCLSLSYSAHKTSGAGGKCQCFCQKWVPNGSRSTSCRGIPACWDTGSGLPYIRWRRLP